MSQRPDSFSPAHDGGSSTSSASSSDEGRSSSEQLADAARETATDAKRRPEELYRETSRSAYDASDAIDATAEALAESGYETLSDVAASLSDRVRTFSSYLENRQLDELIDDARRLAQRNPALFVAGGVALGFTLSRFLKASGSNRRMVS